MIFSVKISTHFDCSLERAFKTPILCDITKIHTGFWLNPRVTHTLDDEDWGRIGSSKRVFVSSGHFNHEGWLFSDHIVDRKENEYWKIKIDNFQSWLMGFHQFEAEWRVVQISEDKTFIEYLYHLHSNQPLLYPLQWIFSNFYWKKYMNHVVKRISQLALDQEPFQHD